MEHDLVAVDLLDEEGADLAALAQPVGIEDPQRVVDGVVAERVGLGSVVTAPPVSLEEIERK